MRVDVRRLAATVFLFIGLLLMVPAVAQAQAPTATSMGTPAEWAGSSVAAKLNGTNLGVTGTTTVTVGGVAATGVTVGGGGTQLTFTIPGMAAGDYNVVVTTPAGSTAPLIFEFAALPTITAAYAPATIATTGSSTLTLTIANPNARVPLTVAVSAAALPAGLTGTNPATNCTSGIATSSGSDLSLLGASISAKSNCTVTLTVTASTPNTYPAYTSGAVSASRANLLTGTQTAATATTPTGLTVTPAPLAVTPGAASGTTVSLSYSQSNPASGGVAPYTYALASGSLPAGTTLDPNTGTVTGTPTTAGPFSYAIKATDSQGTPATATGATVSGAIAKGAQTISFTGPATTSLSASPVSIGATSTSGLAVTFTSATTSVCTVSGNSVTLVTTGTCTINADQAGNSNWNAAPQVPQSFTVTPAALVIAAGAVSATQVGTSFSQTNPASGGVAPYAYTLASGALPAGTTLDSNTGTVSGSPTTAAPFSYAIKATDSQGPPVTATAATVSGTIAKGAQTISFTGPSATSLSASPVSISATATSGFAVTFSSATTSVCTVSGNSVTLQTTGTCTIAADQTGDSNWNAAPQVPQSFTVTPATLVVTPAAVSGTTVGASYSQSNPASGGVAPYSYALASGSLPAGTTLNVSTGAVSGTPTTAGPFSYQIQATDNAGPTHATATGATVSGSIGKGVQTINFTGPATTSLSASPVSLSATATSGLAVTFTSVSTAACTVSGSAVTLLTTGTCTINADQAGDANYNAAPQVQQSFTVTPATLAVTAGAASGTQVATSYSQSNPATGGVAPYTYALASGSLPAGTTLNVSNGTVSGTPTTAGPFSYAIKATDSQGSPVTATGATVSGTIAKGAQSISFTGPATTSVSASPVSISGTATSGLAVTFSSATTSVCTVSGNSVTLLSTGSCTINADQAGDNNWNAASQVSQTFAVAPATLAVTPAAASGLTVGASFSQANPATGGTAPYTYAVASGSLPAGTMLNVSTGVVSGAPTTAGPFSYAIKATDSQGPPATATGATVSGTIAKGAQIISFTGPTTTSLSASPVSISATATSGLAVTFISTSTAVCTVSGNSVTLLTAGTCTIAADQAGNTNYNAAPQVQQSFTVTAAALAVTAGTASGATVGVSYSQANPASGGIAPYAYALASGSLPVGTTLNVTTGMVSGTPTSAGPFSYQIQATDNAGPPHVTALGAMVSGTIAKGAQTISFTGPATASVSASPVSISATSTSGLAITFTSTTTSVCTVSGNSVTLLTAGTCIIAADQAGNVNYNAAGQVVQSFTVTAAATIVFTPAAGTLVGGTVGNSYSQTIAASGGTGPYTYSLMSGSLPGGLSLNASTGQISGTPAATGSFNFTVSARDAHNDAGTAAYTLAITAPTVIAVSSNVTATAGTTATVDLTNGAVGGPFTGALLLSLSPASAGSAVITLGDTASNSDVIVADLVSAGHYLLKFTPASTFSGTAVATFTLTSAFGTSAPAKVTFVVSKRPDPAQDPNVIGLVTAQAQAARHFASTQIANFNDRLEGLHDGCQHHNAFNISLSDSRNPIGSPLTRAGVGDTAAGTEDSAFWRDRLRGGFSADGSDKTATSVGQWDSGASARPGPSPNSRASGEGIGRHGDAVANTRSRKNAKLGECEVEQRFAAWTGGSVTFGKLTTGTNAGTAYISSGVSAGIDYWFSPAFTAGIGLGYGQDRSEIGTNGTVSKAFGANVAAYGSWHPSRVTFVDMVIGYGIMDFDSNRFSTVSNQFAAGGRSGRQVFGSLTSGYEYRADGLLVSPYARISAASSTLDAFTESSGGAFALSYGAQTVNSFTGGFGLRAAYAFKQPWGIVTPRLRIEYAHEFEGASHASVAYADLGGGAGSALQVAQTGSDYINAELGADVSFASDWMVGINYRTTFGQEKTPPHTVQMRLNSRF